MTDEFEKKILDSLYNIDTQMTAICTQLHNQQHRIQVLENTMYTPLPYPFINHEDESTAVIRRRRKNRIKQQVSALVVQLGFVAIFVIGGGLLFSRSGTVGWQELVGLTILGTIVAGLDIRKELREWIGNGKSNIPGAGVSCLIVTIASLFG